MTALESPLAGSEHAAAAEPSHAVVAACSDPSEAEMSVRDLLRFKLGKGCDPLAGSRILAARFTERVAKAA